MRLFTLIRFDGAVPEEDQFKKKWIQSRYEGFDGDTEATSIISSLVKSRWGNQGGHCTWNCARREVQKSTGLFS